MKTPNATAELSLGHVSAVFGVTTSDLLSSARSREVVRARGAAAYVLRHVCGQSYPAIGRALNRDHSSVMYLLTRVEEWRSESPAFRDALERAVAKASVGAVEVLVCVGVRPDGTYVARGDTSASAEALREQVRVEAGAEALISWVRCVLPRTGEPTIVGSTVHVV